MTLASVARSLSLSSTMEMVMGIAAGKNAECRKKKQAWCGGGSEGSGLQPLPSCAVENLGRWPRLL